MSKFVQILGLTVQILSFIVNILVLSAEFVKLKGFKVNICQNFGC